MTEFFQTLFDCYNILADPSGQGDIPSATNTLLNFYAQPQALEVLIRFIFDPKVNPTIKSHCVVGIAKVVNDHISEIPVEAQPQIFSSFLQLTIMPESPYVRKFSRENLVQNIMNEQLAQMAAAFIIQLQKANSNDIAIEASLYILTMLLEYIDTSMLMPMSIPLTEAGLNSNSNDTKLAAVLHGLIFANLIQDESGPPLLLKYVDCAMQLLMNYVNSNNLRDFLSSTDILVKNLGYLLDQGPEEINPIQMLNSLLNTLTNRNIHPYFLQEIQILSDILIINSIEDIVEDDELIQHIFQVYFQYSRLIFDPNDECFDLNGHNVFSAICVEFSSYQNALEILWQIILAASQELDGLFSSIVALYYSFSEGYEFFESKIPEIFHILTSGIQCPVQCINEASAKAIGEFALTQKKHIKAISNDLIQLLINKVNEVPNPEFVESIATIACAFDEIGDIFGYIFENLSALLGRDNDLLLHFAIFKCIFNLVKYSPKQAKHFFQPIFNLCTSVISNDEQSDQLKADSIAILSFLIESSPKLFAQYANQFNQIILPNFDSNDTQILYESINAYRYLIQHYIDALHDTIPSTFPKLLELASRDITLQEDEKEIFSGKSEENLDNKIEPNIEVVSSAIKAAAFIVSNNPESLINLQQLLAVIQNQINIGNTDCSYGCAEGCKILIDNLQNLGFNDQTIPLISNIVSLLTQLISSDICGSKTAGLSFECIADVIAADETYGIICCNAYLDSILHSVQEVFQGKKFYQHKKIAYMEEIHPNAMRVVREIIAAMKNDSLPKIGPLVPDFNALVAHKNNDMKDLILQFYGDLVFWATEATNDELKQNTFILALDAIENRNSAIGFGVIKQLATKSPYIIADKVGVLLGFIKSQLDNALPPTEAVQSIQDNALSALAMIAMNVLKDQFPVPDFIEISLRKMPAQYEVEENNTHIEFYGWLFQRAGQLSIQQQFLPLFAAVPIRLFSDPISTLIDDYYVSPENVTRMQQMLRNFKSTIPNFDNFISEICENDQFKIESVFEALSNNQ